MRVWAIASNTLREGGRQASLYVLTLGFALIILAAPLYTAFGFGEEGPMMREAGQATVVLCGLLSALVMSSRLVHREISQGTARMVLSKPIEPHHFFLGKFLGLALALLVVTAALTVCLVVTYRWKEGILDPDLAVGGLVAYLEVLVLASLALAFSVHLSFVPNAALCGTVFILGRMPSFFGEGHLLSAPRLLLPDFAHFQLIQQAVTRSTPIDMRYLLMAALYGLLYTAAATLLGVFWMSQKENL